MLGQTWNHSLIRKHIIIFGSLFTDIYINRQDEQDANVQTIQVPVSYGPKEKFLARIKEDPDLKRPSIVLPRMGFEIQSIAYAPDRKLNTINRSIAMNPSDNNKYNFLYSPVPYDFKVELYILAKTIEDSTQIIEQILPMFTPDWTINTTLIPELNIVHDIPVVLQSVDYSDSYDGSFETRRAIVWSLGFIVRGYLYGPIRKASIVKKTAVHFYGPDANTIYGTFTVQPGLTANGQPTSNAALSIDINDIAANSNYGFIEDLFNDS